MPESNDGPSESQKLVLAVDLGGTQVRIAVAGRSLTLAGRQAAPTDHSRGPQSVVEQIVRMCHAAMRDAGVGVVDSMVIACPGPLDSAAGVVYSPPNLLGWGEVDLVSMIQRRFLVPCTIMNDANAGALAEYHLGAGRGSRTMVYLTISTGIGGGVIVDGSLLAGTSGTAGEIGHITIDRHGPMCKCGNRGCIEVIASGTAIGRRYAERVGLAHSTGAEVAARVAAGDPVAADVFRDAAEAVGMTVVTCLHVFNPEVVVLGGGVTNAGPLLFEPILEIVERYALPVPRRAARLVRAALREDTGLIGAAGYGFERLGSS